MKKLLCVLLAVATGGCLYGQTETADKVDTTTVRQIGVVEIAYVETEEEVDPDEPFLITEEMPVFVYKGNSDTKESFKSYVADSIRVPSADCQGKVYVQFVVERDSTVDKVVILRGLDGCDGYAKEVERLILSMPKWIPGRNEGMPARVRMTMPVAFLPMK
ncbi:MAG TPA: hypothetical protein PKH02_04875 [Bacteroidales bacterium]|nr:hypothetical protein [Bacteroidales bacterium]HPT11688.1 hypothetical protein [Bacteroidales bacterium]